MAAGARGQIDFCCAANTTNSESAAAAGATNGHYMPTTDSGGHLPAAPKNDVSRRSRTGRVRTRSGAGRDGSEGQDRDSRRTNHGEWLDPIQPLYVTRQPQQAVLTLAFLWNCRRLFVCLSAGSGLVPCQCVQCRLTDASLYEAADH